MSNRARFVEWSSVGKGAVLAFVAVSLAVASTAPGIGWIVPIAVVGGTLMAVLMIAMRSRAGHLAPSPDSFQGGAPDNVVDISRVRVAGVGGLGLVIVAGIVALQYQLISAVLIAGAIGGAVAGVVMILHRRRRGEAAAA